MSQRKEWAHEIERSLGLDAGESTDCRLSVTGEPYIEFTSFGVFDGTIGGWAYSEEKALEMLTREIVGYWDSRNSPTAKAYWRVFPELHEMTYTQVAGGWGPPGEERTVYVFYARLLISAKPVLEKAA